MVRGGDRSGQVDHGLGPGKQSMDWRSQVQGGLISLVNRVTHSSATITFLRTSHVVGKNESSRFNCDFLNVMICALMAMEATLETMIRLQLCTLYFQTIEVTFV